MVKTAGFTFGSRLLSAILSFGLVVLVSRWLGPEIRGICGLYLVIIAIITAIGDMAGGSATPYLLQHYRPATLLKGQLLWSVFPGLLVPLVFVCISGISVTECIMLGLAGWLSCTWSVQQQLLLGLKKFAAFNVMTFIVPATTISGFVFLYFLGFRSSMSYLYAILISYFTVCAMGLVLLKEPLKSTGKNRQDEDSRLRFKKAIQNQSGHLASLLNSRLIFLLLPAGTLGLWSNALSLGEAIFLIPGSLGQVSYGWVAASARSEKGELVFQKAWWANLAVMVPCLFVTYLMPDVFWKWLFGQEFAGISNLLRLIIPGIGLYSLYLLISYCQSAYGNFLTNFYTLAVGMAVNLLVTGTLWISGNYTLKGGMVALVAGWGIAAMSNLIALRYTNYRVFRSFFRLPGLPKWQSKDDLGPTGI